MTRRQRTTRRAGPVGPLSKTSADDQRRRAPRPTGHTAAAQALCDGAKLALKPKELAFTDAAALPTAYLTSLQALRTHRYARIEPFSRRLVGRAVPIALDVFKW